jgi:hypothetical protein
MPTVTASRPDRGELDRESEDADDGQHAIDQGAGGRRGDRADRAGLEVPELASADHCDVFDSADSRAQLVGVFVWMMVPRSTTVMLSAAPAIASMASVMGSAGVTAKPANAAPRARP